MPPAFAAASAPLWTVWFGRRRSDYPYPRRNAPPLWPKPASLTDGNIGIGPMLPVQHPISSENRVSFGLVSLFDLSCRPNARDGYMPLMLVCRRLRGHRFGEALFPRIPRPGLNWRPASGPI